MIEIEKTLKIQNERLNSHERVNQMQDKHIGLLQSRTKDQKTEIDTENVYKNSLSSEKIVRKDNTVKNELQDDNARVKRQVTPKFIKHITVSLLPPYPDNPDIVYRRGRQHNINLRFYFIIIN